MMSRAAVSSHPSQSTRSRRPRHWPTHQIRSHLFGLCPWKDLLRHVPDILLCPPPYDGLSNSVHKDPPLERCYPSYFRYLPRQVCRGQLPMVSPHEQLPCRVFAPLRGTLHCRARRYPLLTPRYIFWLPNQQYIFENQLTPKPKPSGPNILAAETYSYYGILNLVTYNVGYHNEHHDFPAIPWTRLPKLTQIAMEFYEPLPTHTSWSWVIWEFIWNKDLSLWSRVKREQSKKVTAAWTRDELENDEAKKN